jgi:predicted dehydrogenase
VRLLQVGVRGMGNRWVEVGKRSTEVEVVGYVDILPEHLGKMREEHGISEAACFTDLDAALAALRPDAVVIVTPPQSHMDIAIKAMQADCHVLTEKPLADTWVNCRAVVAEARRTGKTLMVAQNYRYTPAIQTFRRAIAESDLGLPGQVSVQFFKGPRFGGFREEMPYPLIIDMSIHHYDLARYLLSADPVSIYAQSWNPPWSWFAGDASSTSLVEMQLQADPERRVRLTYTASWCTNGGATTWNGEWRVFCPEGCVILRDDRVYVQRRDGQDWEEVPTEPIHLSGQDYLLHEFMAAVSSGRQPETSGYDNLKSIEMVFKTIESIKQSKRLKFAGE